MLNLLKAKLIGLRARAAAPVRNTSRVDLAHVNNINTKHIVQTLK